MALTKFTDAAGREAYLDTSTNMVFTDGGKNPTYYTKDSWNQRQLKKYGSSGSGSGESTPESTINDIMKANEKSIKEEQSWLSQYTSKNPFVFDELLAKQSATAEYEPYYTELLNDYLSDIDTQRKTVQDDQRLSTTLNEYDVTQTNRDYDKAIAQAEEGFAGSGMFFSGIKNKSTGELGIGREEALGSKAAQYENTQADYGRQLGLLDTQAAQKQRDVQRELQTNIESGILKRKDEALKGYYTPMTMAYSRKYPTSGTSSTSGSNILSGYVPAEYLRY